MAHDIFISHSSKDKVAADMACALLERNGLRCWIAPRDIQPGADWATSILNAIYGSRVMLLVFSSHANSSEHVRREVERAVHGGITLVPVRIENAAATESMEYFLSTSHWMDAITPPLEKHISVVANALRAMLGKPGGINAQPVPPSVATSRAKAALSGGGIGGTRSALAVILLLIAVAACGAGWIWKRGHRGAPAIIPKMESVTAPVAAKKSDMRSPDRGMVVLGVRIPAARPITFVNSLQMRFSRIEPGTFQMGSPDGPSGEPGREGDEVPHQVTLTKAFFMAQTHVTVGQFARFVTDTNYQTDADAADPTGPNWRKPGILQDEDHPVVCVSWNDAVQYAKWLNEKEKTLTPRRVYSLPTEARWEYACRNSNEDRKAYNTGDTLVEGKANFGARYNRTTPVGKFKSNARGLYDMHGNAWQWCYDIYAEYGKEPITDPAGPNPTDDLMAPHVIRGGSWKDNVRNCRSAARHMAAPDKHNFGYGFRVCLDFQ